MKHTSDAYIIAASLLILNRHLHETKRPIRPLIDIDFHRIRCAKKKVGQRWYLLKHEPKADFAVMRSRMLDGWMKKHSWDIRTRNLYSSILAKLTVWEQHGISPRDKKLLQEFEPGARLFLQFLSDYKPVLI